MPNSPSKTPVIALTPGEPAGIGPDLSVMLAQKEWRFPIVAFTDVQLLENRAKQLNLSVNFIAIEGAIPTEAAPKGCLYVKHIPIAASSLPGELNSANSEYVLETLRAATHSCLNGESSALVTAPVHKGIINDAGIRFSGHTEFLADMCSAAPVMMLACPGLRVALATTHLPLRDIADAITPEILTKVINILHSDLINRYGISQPKIKVCGLNPHAGEDGHLGREEIEVITPTLNKLREQGIDLTGPLPADTLFTPRHLEDADAVLAMYHDQGLPVLKFKGFGGAVNVTLGLPIVRTSVDHGTALTLAGTGNIDSGSLDAAIVEALSLCNAADTFYPKHNCL